MTMMHIRATPTTGTCCSDARSTTCSCACEGWCWCGDLLAQRGATAAEIDDHAQEADRVRRPARRADRRPGRRRRVSRSGMPGHCWSGMPDRFLDASVRGTTERRRVSDRARTPTKGCDMTVAKTIELTATSPTGFEAAIQEAVEKANQTLRNVEGPGRGAMLIGDGKVTGYRVHLEVTFVLD